MDARAAYDRIEADMRGIWGDMAPAMLRKRLRDVQATLESLSREELQRVVELLRARTLPSVLGTDGAEAKATQYLTWIADGI
ncbi:MAG: hypothetical protein A3K68_02040 [Euryarchaeota archaeon RBG_16_68_13]|nr:MAG: hypothetical protein A3K68_02040 [Euryarchaeota archaeon RBG_16_68_13]